MGNRGWAAAGTGAAVGGLALLLTACGSSGTSTGTGSAYGSASTGASPSSPAMSGGAMGVGAKTVTLTTETTKIGNVLTNDQGDTLYWYSKDTKDGPSTCSGSCLAEWPIVAGKAVAASGVKFAGALGSVTDAGGAIQATYDGYPLYTFKGDMTPGQMSGNGEGGVWHVFSGAALTAAAGMSSPPATKSVTSSGGYGYGSAVAAGSGTSSDHPTPAARAKATTVPLPATPAPTTAAPVTTPTPGSTEVAGCGEGACW